MSFALMRFQELVGISSHEQALELVLGNPVLVSGATLAELLDWV